MPTPLFEVAVKNAVLWIRKFSCSTHQESR